MLARSIPSAARVAVPLAALALLACGGGGSRGGTRGTTTQTPTVAVGPGGAFAKGTTLQLRAASSLAGVEEDCTAMASWTSSNPAIAAVAAGLATGVGEGIATITASYEGASASVDVTVGPAALVRFDVSPGAATAPRGAPLRFHAVGTYTDASIADLTGSATWTSSAPDVAAVSSAFGKQGLALATAVGTTTITATHAPTGLAASATVTVSAATLSSLALTATPASVPLGLTSQVTATGTYSDGSTADLTPIASFASLQPATVTVSSAAGSRGLAEAVGVGVATIEASAPDAGGAPFVGSTTIIVTDPVVAALTVDPPSPSIVVGGEVALTAHGLRTDDTIVDLTSAATWSSSDEGIATVTPGGLVRGVAAGVAAVTATDVATGFSASAAIEVLSPSAPPALSYVTLSPGSVRGGSSSMGRVFLTTATIDPIVVTLSSSSAYASVPVQVTIAAGEVSVTFTVSTTTPPSRKARATIGATYDGVSKQTTLNVRR